MVPDSENASDDPTATDAPVSRPADSLELMPTTVEKNPPQVPGGVTLPPGAGSGEVDAGLAPFVDLAIADLAERLDVQPDAITATTAVLVTWPDSSLGCPEPGMQYAQALQDGSLIELAVEGEDGAVYRYHSGGPRTPFYCDVTSDG